MEAGQAQLQEELHVSNLEGALKDVRECQGEMTGHAISDVVTHFWKLKISKPENKLMHKHRLRVQSLVKEFWDCLTTGIQNIVSSTMASCIEELLHRLEGTDVTKEEIQEFDLDETLQTIACSEVIHHEFWTKDVGLKKLPQSLTQLFDSYGKACDTVQALTRYVFAKNKIGTTRVKDPTSDLLHEWTACDVLVCAFVEEGAILKGFKETFVKVAVKDLDDRAMTAFQDVGRMISNCMSAVSDLDTIAGQLAEVKNIAALGKNGLWNLVLPSFIKAGS